MSGTRKEGQLSAESSVRSVSTVASRSGMGARQLPSQRPTGNWGASRPSGMPGGCPTCLPFIHSHAQQGQLSWSASICSPHMHLLLTCTSAGSSKRGYRPSTSARRTTSSRAGEAIIDPFAPIKVSGASTCCSASHRSHLLQTLVGCCLHAATPAARIEWCCLGQHRAQQSVLPASQS